MIDNIDEKLRQAQIAKDKDDMFKHAERTRQAGSFITAQYICKEFDEESVLKKQILFCNTILEVNS